MKKYFLPFIIFFVFLFFSIVWVATAQEQDYSPALQKGHQFSEYTHPLRIPVMEHMNFPGSDIAIEEVLPKEAKFDRYIVSFQSEQLKEYAFLAVPRTAVPKGGFPSIVIAHGYVPPEEYVPGNLYPELIQQLVENGYVVMVPDLRGHGNSEGNADGAYFSASYTIDFLNAISSLERQKFVNRNKVGVMGHSMGGHIVLRTLVVHKNIKAAVIWSGVVGSYTDILFHWDTATPWNSSSDREVIRPEVLEDQFGTINTNPQFWNSISPVSFLSNITSPIQLHHGVRDFVVPAEFSSKLAGSLSRLKKPVEYYEYTDASHEFTGYDLDIAIVRSLQFFHASLQ